MGEALRGEALTTLARIGLVDDRRFAERRADALAARCAGDALIRHDLDVARDGRAALAPARARAQAIVARRGASPKTARFLAGKGFSDDVVREVVARAGDETLG